MSISTSFSSAKQSIRRGAFALAVAGIAAAAPAFAQQATPVAVNPIPAEITTEVNARLKQLSPIIRNSPQEYARLGYDQSTQERCSAQTVLYGRAMMGFKTDETYSYAIAKADMRDLEAMTRFATCTLPGGLQAKLNVCSALGMALSGKLMETVFDPRLIDVRPVEVRCPAQPQQQAALN